MAATSRRIRNSDTLGESIRGGGRQTIREDRWRTISPSAYEWERSALDYLREQLPDHDPYRAWSNFEFLAEDGRIYEVDLLVLTKVGFWLVEIKSMPGVVRGDAGTWAIDHDGRTRSVDNPLPLANRKAKALISLLRKQRAVKSLKHSPFLEPVVFLSHESIDVRLEGVARNGIFTRDRETHSGEKVGIREALVNRRGPGLDGAPRTLIDRKVMKALSEAIDSIGVRESASVRRIGEYEIQELLDEGPGYQDWLARHTSLTGVERRIRQYQVARACSEKERIRLKETAEREFRILQRLSHPGILSAKDFSNHENGPALIFEHEPGSLRLDHFLVSHWSSLTVDTRLDLLRQLIHVIQYAHGKKIRHRALTPQCVLVTHCDEPRPVLQVFDWKVSQAEPGGTIHTLQSVGTTQFEAFIERDQLVYIAPEVRRNPREVIDESDVFSVGAIAHLLFSGRPPAANLLKLAEKLKEDQGVRISAVLDGAASALEELIRRATHPNVHDRIESADEFLDFLELLEDELTAPAGDADVDPLYAQKGDTLANGLVVERVLGKGSTAVALWVRQERDKAAEHFVLKVARDDDKSDESLQQEARALARLRHPSIVELRESLELGGRRCLLLSGSDPTTLRQHLRKEGTLTLEHLQSFGVDLLQVLAYLEEQGIAHRDWKPENISVLRSDKKRMRPVLFDFSLAGAPADAVHLGTPPYLDPFLQLRKRWDPAAEIYSMGVVLYELATGTEPKWGDGVSDPALTDAALSLEPERFDAAVRAPLARFFERSLAREAGERFDNAEEMLSGWRLVFAEKQPVEVAPTQLTFDDPHYTLETPIRSLGLSTRAHNALDRAQILTVADLLGFPTREIRFLRGVGSKTRSEIVDTVVALRKRFPEAAGRKATPVTTTTTDDTPLRLEDLRDLVAGKVPGGKGRESALHRHALLGVHPDHPQLTPETWPTQAEVAEAVGVTRARIGQILTESRRRWSSKLPVLTEVRQLLAHKIRGAGGILSRDEAIALLEADIPSDLEGTERRAAAAVVTRAAVETEQGLQAPGYRLHRARARSDEPQLWIVATRADDTGTPGAPADDWPRFVTELGDTADAIASADPLLSPDRARDRLNAVGDAPAPPLECAPLSSQRRLELAVAASRTAAVSSRGEIYPRGLPADRALRLGAGALMGLGLDRNDRSFPPAAIHDRIRARYPDAEPLPDRPKLDLWLADIGLDVDWNEKTASYLRREKSLVTTAGSTLRTRPSVEHYAPTDPERQSILRTQKHLANRYHDHGFLVLRVAPRLYRRALDQLTGHFSFETFSVDRWLLQRLQQVMTEKRVERSNVLEADAGGPEGPNWHRLLVIGDLASADLPEEVLSRKTPVLLTDLGLLGRYGRIDRLETIREGAGTADRCPVVWALVPDTEQLPLPRIDTKEIPTIDTMQRLSLPEAWVRDTRPEEVDQPA